MNKITSNIRNYSFGLILLSCMGGMSCTREADIDMTDTDGVVFSANIGQASRRGDNSWTGGELIGMQVGESVKTYRISDAATGAMVTDDEPYTWTSGEYQLHAWSPYTDKSISLTDQSDAEKMFACDLLECNTTVNAQSVQLTFKHKMTRVWYELQQFPGYTEEEANNAVISYYGHSSIKYTEGIIEKEGEPNSEILPRKIDDRHGEAILVPGEMWDKPFIKVVIGGDTYVYTPKHTVATDEERQTGVLKEGYNQRYYLKVSKKGIEVSMESSSVGWEDETVAEIKDGNYFTSLPKVEDGSDIQFTYEGINTETGEITGEDKSFSISYTETGNGGLDIEGNCEVKRETNVQSASLSQANGEGSVHKYTISKVASDIKITYNKEYLKVGKYMYSNGTFGDDAVKEGCETVGLVYKLGASVSTKKYLNEKGDDNKAKEETITNEADYIKDVIENYTGSDLKSITGYVVALNASPENINWANGDTMEDAFKTFEDTEDMERSLANEFKGYAYTKSIETAIGENNTNSPFWSAFKAMNLPVAPNTSGWYIPSIAQLKEIASSEVAETIKFKDNSYYSSNVYHCNTSGDNPMKNPHGNNANDHTYVLKLNAANQEISSDYPSDKHGKLILILTF